MKRKYDYVWKSEYDVLDMMDQKITYGCFTAEEENNYGVYENLEDAKKEFSSLKTMDGADAKKCKFVSLAKFIEDEKGNITYEVIETYDLIPSKKEI